MDGVVLCTKDRVGLDNLLTWDTLFPSLGFIMSKKDEFVLCVHDRF